MKVLRGGIGKRDRIFSEERLKAVDAEQKRRRISGAEVEAYIGFATANSLLERNVPTLERLAKETGNAIRLRQASALMGNATKALGNGVSAEQLITIANNCMNVMITISASPVEACCNIAWKALQTICDAAIAACWVCECSRDESKSCVLRKALETVPGVREATKAAGNTVGCPFACAEMEWEGDK